ncbi:hypothetical protein [Alcanivorax sp.]|uniref:hypothetical protein n=1 Tax=Alcanivorax sp. TaxID=1872427 RepID=UPI002B27BCBA|nr:hypothetical protein [Alcanivorax sp.]
MRIFFIVICLFMGFLVFGFKAWNDFWFSAFSGLIAGFVVSGMIVFWDDNDISKLIVQVFGSLSLALGIMGVFAENEAFDIKLNKAHQEAVTQLVKADESCEKKDNKVQKIINYAILACGLQNNRNMQSAIVDIEKQLKISPELGLVDSAISLAEKESISKCKSSFITAYKHCESSFITMSEESKKLLLE